VARTKGFKVEGLESRLRATLDVDRTVDPRP
jgi:hypothetical protein